MLTTEVTEVTENDKGNCVVNASARTRQDVLSSRLFVLFRCPVLYKGLQGGTPGAFLRREVGRYVGYPDASVFG